MRWSNMQYAALTMFIGAGSVLAQPAQNMNRRESLSAAPLALEQVGVLCGVATDVSVEAPSGSGGCRPDRVLVDALVTWVSSHLDLPEVQELPQVKLAPSEELALVRFGGSQSSDISRLPPVGDGATLPSHQHEIAALYEDVTRTIYLQEEWTGATPAELSILVHEVVHHIQNVAGLKYECPESREKLAYIVQAQWLVLFGQTLESEFSLDPMTVLVRTVCPM